MTTGPTDEESTTAAGGPGGMPLALRLSEGLGLRAMLPACWTLTETLQANETTTTGCLWFKNPQNTAWEPLYRRAAIARVLAHSREVQEFNEHLHGRNDELRLMLSDMSSLMVRMVAGIDHLAEIARQCEPDHSSVAGRRGWLLAQDAKDDAKKLLAKLPSRIHRPNVRRKAGPAAKRQARETED